MRFGRNSRSYQWANSTVMDIREATFCAVWETPERALSAPILRAQSAFIWIRMGLLRRVGEPNERLWNFRLAGFLLSRLVTALRGDDLQRIVRVRVANSQHDSANAGENVLRGIAIAQKAFNSIGFEQSLNHQSLRFVTGVEHRD